MFLEPSNFVQRGQMRVGQNHTHHRHCQQAAFVKDVIRRRVNRQQRAEHHRNLHIFRHFSPVERPCDDTTAQVAQNCRNRDSQHQMPDRPANAGGCVQCDDHLIGQHRSQGADRIVDDSLPLEDFGHPRLHPRLSQQGRNNGGSGHDHDPAKNDGAFPAQPRHIVCSQ